MLNSAVPTILHDDKFKLPQSLRAGQKLVVDAKVSGIPSPNASWSLNGQPLTASALLAVEASSSLAKLTFTNSSVEQSGTYVLKAENLVGTAQAEFTIVVKGKHIDIRLCKYNLHSISIKYSYITFLTQM